MGSESYQFEDLKKTYGNFASPVSEILIDGEALGENEFGISISDLRIEETCGFEASIASYMMYNVFDDVAAQFRYKAVKKYIQLGSVVVIYMGYDASVREVFRGFIAKVNFVYDEDDIPGIRITAMDLKGIMMANSYSKQFKAQSYSGAVKEIFRNEPYSAMLSQDAQNAMQEQGAPGGGAAAGGSMPSGGGDDKADDATSGVMITDASIEDTPDAKQSQQGGGGGEEENSNRQSETTYTVEMVGESDYEFIVKAAKKFNFEFYILGGRMMFRKAKKDTSTLMTLSPATMLSSLDVEYDITGLVSSVEVRNVDPGKGKLLTTKKKNSNKIGSKAKNLIKNMEKVFIDPTADSKDDTGHSAEYLLEDMVYRFGTIRAGMVGLPEMVPGKFIDLKDLGDTVDNTYYIMSVTHTMSKDGMFHTEIVGKAAKV